ncbi:hypothetical protein [Maribellus sediminis]|uniref:hypothetical protein n=1 Tax=Maribellus sediminis TaxID=2696285 RepID=UPI00142F4785|nr:hypothetical protein [Maribellus sediminis]
MEILFDKKFTERDLDKYIEEDYVNSQKEIHKKITFILELLEWISSEEVTFIFAWIKQLLINGKKVEVKLPLRNELIGDELEEKWVTQEELNELRRKKSTVIVIERLEEDQIKVRINKSLDRRKILNVHLYLDWELSNTGIRDLNIKNLPDDIKEIIRAKIYYANKNDQIKKVLPFQVIPTERFSVDSIDKRFLKNTSGQFTLDNDITDLLNDNNCYSPFENKVISDVITKELFMNSAEHAQIDECYFTSALIKKWKRINTQYFNEHFLLEKDKNTINFFKDKVKLEKIVKDEVEEAVIKNFQKTKDRILKDGKDGKLVADLSKLPKYLVFKNQSFLEFTFIDFGTGIYKSLKDAYYKKTDLLSDKLSNNDEKRHLHSKILEFAFLLDSSKDPFDDRIERSELIPRGLYFLIDMVRRYKGLMVVRSGYGKVIYDFSDRIIIVKDDNDNIYVKKERIYIAKDAVVPISDENPKFHGTMVSIVLPEREKGKFRKAGVRIDDLKLNKVIYNREQINAHPKEVFAPEYYDYLPLAFIYQVSKSREYFGNDLQSIYNDKNTIINTVFISINNKLKELNEKEENGVLYINFENLPKKNYVYKILLYLSNSPFVNEKVKVIAVNINNDELNTLKELAYSELEEYNGVLSNESSFLFKAIPCIKLNKILNQKISTNNVQWIGVPDIENDFILTNLLLGGKDIHISKIDERYQYLYEGNIISLSGDGWASSIFTDISELTIKPKEIAINSISEWIIKEIIKDGELKSSKYPEKRLFLTSQGAYQKKYLSFFDTLSFDYSAEYFSKYLLDKYIDTLIDKFEDKTNLNFDELTESQKYIIKRTFKFDKILAVTVSSQFLAIQLRNLVWENIDYFFLAQTKKEGEDDKLLKDLDVILNDEFVSENTIKDFFDSKQNQINDYYQTNNHKEVNLDDCPALIKLSSYHSFDKEKPFEKIYPGQNIVVINDVISTGSLVGKIIEGIEKKESNIKAILTIADTRTKQTNSITEHSSHYFEKYEDRIISVVSSESNIDLKIERPKYKPIGKFSIKRINPILNTIVTLNSKHTEKNRELLANQALRKVKINENIFQIGHFKQSPITCSSYFTDMNVLLRGERGFNLLSILKKRMDKSLSGISQSKCEPYFIFHPVYSGIEEITKETYFKVFNPNKEKGKLDIANIISLQRYETPYGWRFVFPSKRFNNVLKGKNILIVDSGTLSGQSLVQLVDAVSIYEVQRIDVLMIIGRLDDFQREFYSRLQNLKVKSLGDDSRQVSAKLNIFFGANLHIPPFHTEDMCPFCKEIKTLNTYLTDYAENNIIPSETKTYITNRLEEIKKQENSNSKVTPIYIPKNKDSAKHDFKNIFLMRDLLGKIDGYRFYEDYFDEIDALCGLYPTMSQKHYINKDIFKGQNRSDLKQFEQILICILHEPSLLSSIRNLLKNLFDILEFIIKKIIADLSLIEKLNYEWSKYSLVRIYYSVCDERNFYTLNNFELLFNFCNNDDSDSNNTRNYLSYIIWEGFYLLHDNILLKERLTSILLKMNEKFDVANNESGIYANDKLRNIIKSIVHRFEITNIENVNDAFFNLRKFFIKESSNDSHSDLKRSIFKLISGIENKDVKLLLKLVENITNTLKTGIWQNLIAIKHCVELGDKLEYNRLYHYDDSIYKRLYEIIQEYEKIYANKTEINNHNDIDLLRIFADKIDNFQTDFLLENKPFPEYCSRYKANLRDCIENACVSAKNRYNKKKNQKTIVTFNNFIEENLYVNAHRDLIEYAFEEIFYNSINHQNKIDTVVEIQSVQNDLLIELNICQNKKFLPSERVSGHGIDTIVKPIFNSFSNGHGIALSCDQQDKFEIVITFNRFNLKNR